MLATKPNQTHHNLWGLDLLGQDDGQAQKLTLLTDALGSVRAQMRGTSLQASTSYGPYGSIHQQTGTSQTSYGYTGEQFHAGTGLLYLRARYYSPALHAFTSRDLWVGSIQRPMTLHGYNYAYNSPVNFTDPSGLDAWWCDSRPYENIPSHGYDDARKNCYAQQSRNYPQLWGSDAPYLVYKGDFTGILTFYNALGDGIHLSWSTRSGALPGTTSGIDALSGDNSYRGVPYISNGGYFAEIEGDRYRGGTVCYGFNKCYRYPPGTFAIDWPNLYKWHYDNSFRNYVGQSEWDENTFGPVRFPLDEQGPNNILSGVFIHGGSSAGRPTYGCIRLDNNHMIELLGTINQLSLTDSLHLFVDTPMLKNRPAGQETWWYQPSIGNYEATDLTIEDGYLPIHRQP